ncbi:MAG: D-alanine--D-alanine ligase, partial [Candidatus Zixiibacteriota bacterium]
LYDYHAKYTSGGSEYTSPAKIPEERSQELQRDSATIYRALGCSGLARVDFILDENGQRWFLELNTIPGLTELSLAPMSAAAAGVGFDQLLQMMADSALAR